MSTATDVEVHDLTDLDFAIPCEGFIDDECDAAAAWWIFFLVPCCRAEDEMFFCEDHWARMQADESWEDRSWGICPECKAVVRWCTKDCVKRTERL